MFTIKIAGSTHDSNASPSAISDRITASKTNIGSSLSTKSLVSLMTTEKPARKHFSLQILRISEIAFIVSSEAPGLSYCIIIMVASPEKNTSRNSAGMKLVGIWIPTMLDSQIALLTPSTS